MKKNKRLTGVDLVRGLAAYAVTLLHSRGGTSTAPDTVSAIAISVSSFAVPFFLATSFYLSFNKLYVKGISLDLKARAIRMLVPYTFWTVVYLAFRAGKFFLLGKPSAAMSLFSDPLGLFLMGGAAVQLYFLPLLFFGSFSVKGMEMAIRKGTATWMLAIASLVSIAIYHLLARSGNAFILGKNIAFQSFADSAGIALESNPLLRATFVIIAWILTCLPYVCLAAFANSFSHAGEKIPRHWRWILIGSSILFFIAIFGKALVPNAIAAPLKGFSALFFALALSENLGDRQWIVNLGSCAFGIYLMHHLIIEIFEFVLAKVAPAFVETISATSIFTIATVAFGISWGLSALLRRDPRLSRVLL